MSLSRSQQNTGFRSHERVDDENSRDRADILRNPLQMGKCAIAQQRQAAKNHKH